MISNIFTFWWLAFPNGFSKFNLKLIPIPARKMAPQTEKKHESKILKIQHLTFLSWNLLSFPSGLRLGDNSVVSGISSLNDKVNPGSSIFSFSATGKKVSPIELNDSERNPNPGVQTPNLTMGKSQQSFDVGKKLITLSFSARRYRSNSTEILF